MKFNFELRFRLYKRSEKREKNKKHC